MSKTKSTAVPRRRKRADQGPPSGTPPWDLKDGADEAGVDEAGDAVDEREIKRRLVDWAELHMLCQRKVCRRAGACAEPEFPCYREFMAELRRHVFPKLREHLRKTMGYPPRQDHSRGR